MARDGGWRGGEDHREGRGKKGGGDWERMGRGLVGGFLGRGREEGCFGESIGGARGRKGEEPILALQNKGADMLDWIVTEYHPS